MAVYNDRSALPGLSGDALTTLRGRVRGPVLTSTDPDYDTARRVWNASIDRHPGAIIRAADTRDLRIAVTHARTHRLPFAIRGGGHDVAGNGTCDGGLVLDLGGLKGIRVDPNARTVRVQPGVVWSELDAALAQYSLALTGGQISSTGVTGLTL
ncbi:MAG TPA: FAD-binding protein, partial [Chloroflexota bacterium]